MQIWKSLARFLLKEHLCAWCGTPACWRLVGPTFEFDGVGEMSEVGSKAEKILENCRVLAELHKDSIECAQTRLLSCRACSLIPPVCAQCS